MDAENCDVFFFSFSQYEQREVEGGTWRREGKKKRENIKYE